MVALNKNSGKKDKRLPVTKSILTQMIMSTKFVLSHDYDISMYSAMFSIAYYACLRVGEYCVSTNANHVIKADQISVASDSHVKSIRIKFISKG